MKTCLVEALTALLSVAVAWRFGAGWQMVGGLVLTWTLIPLAFIDLDEQILPDVITLPALWLGLFCYGVSVIVWVLALSRVDLSIAYPMLSIGYIVNAFAAWALFGEALTPLRLVGIAVIVLGVFILARS